MRGRLAAAVLVGYVGIAFAVKNRYPFSTFDMFSARLATASRVIARDGAGRVAEVVRFDGWACDGEPDLEPARCGAPGSFGYTPYLDREALDWVRGHSGGGGAPVEIVRRIWWLTADGRGERTEDCLLARCRAARR